MEFEKTEHNDRSRKCKCCGFQTLPKFEFEICDVCWWQDDPVENEYPDKNMGGANGESLNDYRARWLKEHHREGLE